MRANSKLSGRSGDGKATRERTKKEKGGERREERMEGGRKGRKERGQITKKR